MNSDAEIDARYDFLSSLWNESMSDALSITVKMFTEFDTRKLYSNLHNNDNTEQDVNTDVSTIDQTDVIETGLLLRDSVVSLKAVIYKLQQEVTVTSNMLFSWMRSWSTRGHPHLHHEDTPANGTTAPLNGNVADEIQPRTITTGQTETNAVFGCPP